MGAPGPVWEACAESRRGSGRPVESCPADLPGWQSRDGVRPETVQSPSARQGRGDAGPHRGQSVKCHCHVLLEVTIAQAIPLVGIRWVSSTVAAVARPPAVVHAFERECFCVIHRCYRGWMFARPVTIVVPSASTTISSLGLLQVGFHRTSSTTPWTSRPANSSSTGCPLLIDWTVIVSYGLASRRPLSRPRRLRCRSSRTPRGTSGGRPRV
ncbi:hypothetical protein SAMN05443661_110165 [Natronobacterium gregoryi]|uniref:Uncharacterized protein n=1 Tax=Natronobacterium gregoryi TaxID=44930 RepID=A0A1I3MIP5_9EURY|nr:hypothetical protein SAMN05443661_110165 [Natronobacterium gregoryi]